jgi:hypothetical protein
MSLFGRLQAARRRRKRIKVARSVTTPLREFVYLDEVSVYSLLASRQGALAAEYTDTATNFWRGELAGSVAGSGGVLKGNISSKTESSQTYSSQVLRKSTVQAAFKEFHEGEEQRLALSPPPVEAIPPQVETWGDLDKALGTALYDGWLIDADSLTRGQLVELEIELQAEGVYRITSIIAALLSMIEEAKELAGGSPELEVPAISAAARILEKLLVGLIPVRCRVVDYAVVELLGRMVLVHRRSFKTPGD